MGYGPLPSGSGTMPFQWAYPGLSTVTITKGFSGAGGDLGEEDALVILNPQANSGNTMALESPDLTAVVVRTSDDHHEHASFWSDRTTDGLSPIAGLEVSDVDGVDAVTGAGKLVTVNTAIVSTSTTATVSTATGLFVGMNVTGVGIPANSYLKSIATPGSGSSVITFSAAATATNGTASLSFTGGTAWNCTWRHTTDYGNIALPTTTTATNPVVTATSASRLSVGMFVVGPGIPVETFITAISGTSVTLNNAPTASGSPVLVYSVVPYGGYDRIFIDMYSGAFHLRDRRNANAFTLSADGATLQFGDGGNLITVLSNASIRMSSNQVIYLNTAQTGVANPAVLFASGGSLYSTNGGTIGLAVPTNAVNTNTVITAGSTTGTVSSAAGISNGMSVIGPGIFPGTTITISGTTVTFSQAPFATNAAVSLGFFTPFSALLANVDGSLTAGGAFTAGNTITSQAGGGFTGTGSGSSNTSLALYVGNTSSQGVFIFPNSGDGLTHFAVMPGFHDVFTADSSGLPTFTQGAIIASGKALKLGNAATTGLTPGVLAATTNASIVLTDSNGQAYRIPCII